MKPGFAGLSRTACVLLFFVAVGCLTPSGAVQGAAPSGGTAMYAHYINVGQGAAALLEFPCGAILIDTGAQDQEYVHSLVDYVNKIFTERSDLNKTLEAVIVTHNHDDHTKGVREIAENFTVRRYIDNGQLSVSGTEDPKWIRANATTDGRNIQIRTISSLEIRNLGHKNGLTDAFIDPISCDACDPKITILSGRFDENLEWSSGAFDNKNNHSLVIKIDFGEASFLFTGDLEEPALDTLVEYYGDTETLDADVYHVGHHGSANGTTPELLSAVTPDIAVISMGPWDFGRDPAKKFSTYAFGHPRRTIVELLSACVPKKRSSPLDVMVADGAKSFSPYRVQKKIYGTGWGDGTVRVKATWDGKFVVTRNN